MTDRHAPARPRHAGEPGIRLILDGLTRRDGDLLGALLRALKAGWHVARGTVPELAVAPSAESSAT